MGTERLVIAGKITDELDFNFSTRAEENPDKIILLTHHVKEPSRVGYYCIHLSRAEAKKLRDTINVVLNFTPEESG